MGVLVYEYISTSLGSYLEWNTSPLRYTHWTVYIPLQEDFSLVDIDERLRILPRQK